MSKKPRRCGHTDRGTDRITSQTWKIKRGSVVSNSIGYQAKPALAPSGPKGARRGRGTRAASVSKLGTVGPADEDATSDIPVIDGDDSEESAADRALTVAGAALERQRARAHDVLRQQDDPALLEYKDQHEIDADRRDVKTIRRLERRQKKRERIAAVRRGAAKQKAESQIERQKTVDQVWKVKADSRLQRLTDRSSRVARLYRRSTMIARALTGVVVAGILWGGVNVQNNVTSSLGPADLRFWLGFLLEPLASVPLVVLLIANQDCTYEGVTFSGARWSARWWGVLLGEVGIVALLVVMNGFTHFSEPVVDLIPWLMPPVMVSVGVLLQPMISSRYAELLQNAADDMDTGRLEGESARIIEAMARIMSALRGGALQPYDDGLPSVSQAAKLLRVEKRIVQHALDGLRALQVASSGSFRSES